MFFLLTQSLFYFDQKKKAKIIQEVPQKETLGLRASMAAYLWEKTFTAWEKKEWHQLEMIATSVLFLQPHEIKYYDLAAWHMAWNASCDAEKYHDKIVTDYYIQRGRSFLEQGINKNPNNAFLYECLGLLLRDRVHDHAAAATAFTKAAELPGSAPYLRRFVAYELAACPGREKEAYTLLKKLYEESASQRTPALLVLLEKIKRE